MEKRRDEFAGEKGEAFHSLASWPNLVAKGKAEETPIPFEGGVPGKSPAKGSGQWSQN